MSDEIRKTATSQTIPANSVDVRGPRFAAWITTAVLVVVLIAAAFSTAAAAVLIAIQAVVFAIGSATGPRRSPYGRIYAAFVAPRVGPPTETEPAEPLRFAQLLGLIFSAVSLLGFLAGASVVGAVFAGFALFAAFLNAAFGICLGCRIYPLVTRFRRTPAPASN
jgi:thiosulfate/3-mercaptopyruvate sulfurtransferase